MVYWRMDENGQCLYYTVGRSLPKIFYCEASGGSFMEADPEYAYYPIIEREGRQYTTYDGHAKESFRSKWPNAWILLGQHEIASVIKPNKVLKNLEKKVQEIFQQTGMKEP